MNDDGLLVAYADGKLDEDAARLLEGRLAVDTELRARLDLIRSGGLGMAPAFEALLELAPEAVLRAGLARAPDAGPRTAARRRTRIAAAIVLFFFGIGLGRVSQFWPSPAAKTESRDDWRRIVADYVALYTADTFAGPAPDAATRAVELARVGARIGLDLSADRIAIAGAEFHLALAFNYDGAPLGQIAYLDPSGQPILFCILARAPDSELRRETQDGLASVSWVKGGRGYMVIARAPSAQVSEIADALRARF